MALYTFSPFGFIKKNYDNEALQHFTYIIAIQLQMLTSVLDSDLLKRLRHVRLEFRESLPRQTEQEHAGLHQT